MPQTTKQERRWEHWEKHRAPSDRRLQIPQPEPLFFIGPWYPASIVPSQDQQPFKSRGHGDIPDIETRRKQRLPGHRVEVKQEDGFLPYVAVYDQSVHDQPDRDWFIGADCVDVNADWTEDRVKDGVNDTYIRPDYKFEDTEDRKEINWWRWPRQRMTDVDWSKAIPQPVYHQTNGSLKMRKNKHKEGQKKLAKEQEYSIVAQGGRLREGQAEELNSRGKRRLNRLKLQKQEPGEAIIPLSESRPEAEIDDESLYRIKVDRNLAEQMRLIGEQHPDRPYLMNQFNFNEPDEDLKKLKLDWLGNRMNESLADIYSKGYKLLTKKQWVEGQALGANSDDPTVKKTHVGYIPPYIRGRKAGLGGDRLDKIFHQVQIGNVDAEPVGFVVPTATFEDPERILIFHSVGFESKGENGVTTSKGTPGPPFKVYSAEGLAKNKRPQLVDVGFRCPGYPKDLEPISISDDEVDVPMDTSDDEDGENSDSAPIDISDDGEAAAVPIDEMEFDTAPDDADYSHMIW